MTPPIVDAAGVVNQTQLMIGLRTDARATLQALLDGGVHPRDVGIADTTKYGVSMDGDPTANPFFHGPNDGNITDMMRAIKANPKAAFTQMLEAGHEPSEWGIDPATYGLEVVDKETTT